MTPNAAERGYGFGYSLPLRDILLKDGRATFGAVLNLVAVYRPLTWNTARKSDTVEIFIPRKLRVLLGL